MEKSYRTWKLFDNAGRMCYLDVEYKFDIGLLCLFSQWDEIAKHYQFQIGEQIFFAKIAKTDFVMIKSFSVKNNSKSCWQDL